MCWVGMCRWLCFLWDWDFSGSRPSFGCCRPEFDPINNCFYPEGISNGKGFDVNGPQIHFQPFWDLGPSWDDASAILGLSWMPAGQSSPGAASPALCRLMSTINSERPDCSRGWLCPVDGAGIGHRQFQRQRSCQILESGLIDGIWS